MSGERFTLNDYVWVELTERGWEWFDAHHTYLGLDAAPYRSMVDDGSGWQRFQMWHLLEIFGPHVSLASTPPFMEMRFSKPLTGGES